MDLRELPARELSEILFVISEPSPKQTEAEIEALFAEAMTPDQAREIEIIGLGKHYRVAEQWLYLEANWKLAVDTFGECYHLFKKILRE